VTNKRNKAKSRRTDCDKVRYRDQREAKHAILAIKFKGERREQSPVRAYECQKCHGWHLTHLES